MKRFLSFSFYRRVLLLILFTFLNLNSFSQVSGRILDASSDTPLEYATVAIFKDSDSTLVSGLITNVDGFFTFNDITKGQYYIKASFLGFNTKTLVVDVSANTAVLNLGDVKLESGGQYLEDVTIVAERMAVVNKVDR